MGRISHTNLKNSYGDFQNRNFEKSHRTTGPRSDLRPYDLQNFRKLNFLGDDQGELSKGTVYENSILHAWAKY